MKKIWIVIEQAFFDVNDYDYGPAIELTDTDVLVFVSKEDAYKYIDGQIKDISTYAFAGANPIYSQETRQSYRMVRLKQDENGMYKTFKAFEDNIIKYKNS